MSDEITITIPRQREFSSIAHLVVGGLGARLDLTFDALEDLQVALAGLLEEDGDGVVTVAVRIEGDELATSVGPLRGQTLREQLELEAGEVVGLRRVLDTVFDRVAVAERDDGPWIELAKTIERTGRR